MSECSDSNSREGLRLLFGLIDATLDITAWENESNDASCNNNDGQPIADKESESAIVSSPGITIAGSSRHRQPPKQIVIHTVCDEKKADDDDIIFSLAYKCSGYGTPNYNNKIERPSVQIVDLSEYGRGNALVATRKIHRGQVIYTERAAVASQFGAAAVRACQYCFQSLEPISSLSKLLPIPHLWPIPEFEFEEETNVSHVSEGFRCDTFGRVQCRSCESWFCSKFCKAAFQDQYGSCCTMAEAMDHLPVLLSQRSKQDAAEDQDDIIQPAIPLAIRMFAMTLCQYRQNNGNKGTILDGLCGESSDITALELGAVYGRSDTGEICYSLDAVYNHLFGLWSVTDTERKTFSLEHFMALAAQAARNGFGIMTQSPFKAYYAALLRTAGRGSERHEQLKRQVAQALGSEEGKLERGMDRMVEEQVAPEIVALYPLTARINHACAAKAEVRSQEFVDFYMDLVAVEDIEAGEEITISYIRSSRRSLHCRQRRQRELQAKYLFVCDCSLCRE